MKTSVASTLSVAGVVAAGVAAFALNTAVLTTGASDTGAAASPTSLSPAGVAPAPGDVAGASSGDGQSIVDQSSATTVQSAPGSTQVSATVTTYRVGEAGSVVIDTVDGTVSVTNIVPAAGWTAEPARTAPDGSVRVHFVKGSSRVEFVAAMSGGKVAVSVNNETPTVTAPESDKSPVVTVAPPRERHDDDDDDDREEHEDDDDRHEWGEDDDD